MFMWIRPGGLGYRKASTSWMDLGDVAWEELPGGEEDDDLDSERKCGDHSFDFLDVKDDEGNPFVLFTLECGEIGDQRTKLYFLGKKQMRGYEEEAQWLTEEEEQRLNIGKEEGEVVKEWLRKRRETGDLEMEDGSGSSECETTERTLSDAEPEEPVDSSPKREDTGHIPSKRKRSPEEEDEDQPDEHDTKRTR